MKCAVFMLLLSRALAAPHNAPSTLLPAEPRNLGPLADFHPLEAIRSFFSGTSDEEAKPTHELISLSEFPVWRLHHYSGVDLKPVGEEEYVKPLPALSTEYVNAPHTTHEPYEETSTLDALSTGLSVLTGIRDAIGSLRHTITSLPHRLLSSIGLAEAEDAEEETTVEESLPELPKLQDIFNLPEPILKLLPSLPTPKLKHPLVIKDSKKPVVYVNVQTPVKETVTYSDQKLPFELPSSYENPKPHYGAPPQTKGHSSPPQGLVAPLNLPRGNLNEYQQLAVAGANALSQFNTVGEALEAIQSLNDLNSLASLGERSDNLEDGFKPSAGIVLPGTLDDEPTRAAQMASSQPQRVMNVQPESGSHPQHTGHSAISQPIRSAAPRDFKSSQLDPVIIVTPSQLKNN